jgi:hypothetical protein
MLEQGQHVILSFGKYEQDVDYLFVSNLLTRRIREAWEKRTDASIARTKDATNRVPW